MDASNLLKPMRGRGERRGIGATTLDEYRKYIEKDPALERRFQQVQRPAQINMLEFNHVLSSCTSIAPFLVPAQKQPDTRYYTCYVTALLWWSIPTMLQRPITLMQKPHPERLIKW